MIRKYLNGRTVYTGVPLNDTAKWAIEMYSYLLPRKGEFTVRHLANAIAEYYDLSTPKNKAAYDSLIGLERG